MLLCIVLIWLGAGARAQMYSSELASAEWKPVATPFACSLTHSIPNFGKAVLAHKAGGAETLIVETQGKVSFPLGPTGMETLPPVWRNDILPKALGSFMAVAGNQPISLNAVQIAAVVGELNRGTRVMFTSQPVRPLNSSQGLLVMRVVLEARNFPAGYKSYQQCEKNLIPYTFAQVARTTLNFDENAETLNAGQKLELAKVGRYVLADANVVGVFVDGHSDNTGAPETSEARSRVQAEAVSAALVAQGVSADKITTRWHGDKFPIADNAVSAGRAKNRRVTVRLEDEATRKLNEKKAAEEQAEADKKAAQKATEKAEADKAAADTSATSFKSPGDHRMTPEEISRMVEGLDLIDAK